MVGQVQTRMRHANIADAEPASRLSIVCNPRYREDPCAWARAASDQDEGRRHFIAETSPHAGSGEPTVVG